MTTSEITAYIAQNLNLDQKDVRNILNLWGSISLCELQKENKITLPRLGTLHTCIREKRLGRNPQTGESLMIPARTVIKFNMGKFAKETLNS